MPLKFPGRWRFYPPRVSNSYIDHIPEDAIQEFSSFIIRISSQGETQTLIEHFKGYFSLANGRTHVWSSNASWAESDLLTEMYDASKNVPLFIEAFHDACEFLDKNASEIWVPDIGVINGLCEKYNIGYYIDPPFIKLKDTSLQVIQVEQRPNTLGENAKELVDVSLRNAELLLSEGRGREAVQETLWLLESVTTTFNGIETEAGDVEGKYFNQIMRNLRLLNTGPTLNRVIEWVTSLHGYLSSPTGGGIRHGLDLTSDIREISVSEYRLFCNLIRSYLSYLLEEHERLNRE